MSDLDDLEEISTCDQLRTWHRPWRPFSGKTFLKAEHCRNGHEYTKENTRYRKNGKKITRCCLTCYRAHTNFKGVYKPRKKA